MAVVFAALVTLTVAIMTINWLALAKAKKVEDPALLEGIETEKSERARVAVLAVALAKAMDKEREVIPEQGMMKATACLGEPSRWVVSGREQAMRSRGKAGRQWGRRSD